MSSKRIEGQKTIITGASSGIGAAIAKRFAAEGASMRRLSLQKGRQKMIVYYWFQAGDRVANHEWAIRWYRFLDLLVDKPFRPTMIVTLYVDVRDSIDTAEARAMQFLRTMGPHIDRALAPREPSE